MPARRAPAEFSLSFLDVICCGFGAVILLLMITKTVQPQVIEQAMVDGDRRPWLSAVIVPSEELRNIATSPDALFTMVGEAVERANSRLSQLERVRRFIIADEPFSTENGEMTATLKVRRHVVRQVYGERIDALYPSK